MSEDYEKGAVLVFYFADQLKGVEDSGFDIASSMREMILSFDAAKEVGRYDSFAESRKRALAARGERKNSSASTVIAVNPVTNRLIEIEKRIDEGKYSQAESELKTLLDQNPGEPRIYYNLGRAASQVAATFDEAHADDQEKKLEEAKTSYSNVISISKKQPVDPALLSLTYVALGKIYEFYNDKTYAIGIYDAAIKLGNVTGGAFNEALAAKQRLLKNQ